MEGIWDQAVLEQTRGQGLEGDFRPLLTQALRGPWEPCLHVAVRFLLNSILLFF